MVQVEARHETAALISADKVEGTTVYNRQGDKLGTVKTVMIDKLTGRVPYVIMSFGGFLGIGNEYHPLPWNVLDYDTSYEGYVVELDKETLEDAPRIGSTDSVDWSDRAWGQRVHDYYRVPPYWE